MLVAATALKLCCHAVAEHHILETLGTLLVAHGEGVAVLIGKVAHRLVGTHRLHQLIEGDRSRLRVVHAAEEAE